MIFLRNFIVIRAGNNPIIKEETPIRIMSDTYTLRPYEKDFFFYSISNWTSSKIEILGLFTICLHPNIMDSHQFKKVEESIKGNRNIFISCGNVDDNNLSEIKLIEKLVQ